MSGIDVNAALATFAHDMLQRGLQYVREGRVIRIQVADDGTVLGTVRGSGGRVYEVSIVSEGKKNSNDALTGFCTCPVGFACKHMAAVLLDVGAHRAAAQTPAVNPVPAGRKRSPGIDPHFEAWLKELAAVSAPVSASPVVRSDSHQLYFLLNAGLSAMGTHAALQAEIEMVIARVRKDGSLGKATKYSLHDLAFGTRAATRYVTESDREILLKIYARRQQENFSLFGQTLDFNGSGMILRSLLETGRCLWRSVQGATMRIGAARTGQVKWHVRPDSTQSAYVDMTPEAQVLLVDPLWYIDEARHECGPLELNIADGVVKQLLQAPPLRAEHLPRVRKQLNAMNHAVALPEDVSIRRLSRTAPVPVLQLLQAALLFPPGTWYAQPTPTACALLSFDYGGVPVDPRYAEGDELRFVKDGTLFSVPRDHEVEQAATARMKELGFASPVLHHNLGDEHLPGILFTPNGIVGNQDGREQWQKFLVQDLEPLRAAGWRIDMRADFPMRLVVPENWKVVVEEGAVPGWFDIELGITVKGNEVNLLPLLLTAISRSADTFSLDRLANVDDDTICTVPMEGGDLLALPAGRLRGILTALMELYDPNALGADGRLSLSAYRAPELLELDTALGGRGAATWSAGPRVREIAETLRQEGGFNEVPPPPEFKAELRPYQQIGLNWLQFLRRYDLAGVLADDMGLGKTVQALAHLMVEKAAGRLTGPSLVIAPTSLMSTWRREAERFAPALRVAVLHGEQRHEWFERIEQHDLVLTTYPLVVRDEEELIRHDYYLIILDEAQYIKNPRAKVSQVVRRFRAKHRLCLTGTPMENHLGELWSVFDFLMPGFLGDERQFGRVFRVPIEKHGDRDRQQLLRRRAAPFMLRRTKETVVQELPPKTEIIRTVTLEGAQRDLYETVRVAMHDKVRIAVAKKGLKRARIEILDALLKLRQVCCDPRLLKLESAQRVEQSAKLEMLCDMLPELVDEGRRVLLFSQFTSMLELIEPELTAREIRYLKLTGDTPGVKRGALVDAFQQGEAPVFLISLKAGGTGLTLTAADTVIHYDPWWNPAVERQATDRAHRIGQDKSVFVYKLLTEKTVEERISEMQARKQALADGLFEGEGVEATALQTEDVDALFAPL